MSPALTPCPGAENHAWRTAEQAHASHGTPHELTPRLGDPQHCGYCTNRARTELGELPELVAAVWLEAIHGTRTKLTGTIGRTATVASWPGQASRLLTDHIVGGLTDLEDDIRNLRHLHTRPGRGTEGQAVTGAVRFLTAHLEWALTEHPLADEPHDRLSGNPAAQIHGWHRAALRFTARDPRLEHRRVPCPRCELLSLFRADGDDYIECRNTSCGLLLTPGEFDEYVRTLATKHQGVLAT